ncbi:tyrosine-type recombinase/integrase [Acanthopleuribacter pedis]|uniref:Tyrosine-type recombinase/integrase n=1 Tax=Acanthopleuribacter pedis TaxID=442870 RepID=A0A8J7QHE2_9BACT|nr:tyrosine-type recombinase/integrase [Acanthopleuribacter pedis]MBO1322485.1 tyrosine-type recombinase/integrase [Acanthopleuribacter pedis]
MLLHSLHHEFKSFCLAERNIEPKSYRTIWNALLKAAQVLKTESLLEFSEEKLRQFLYKGKWEWQWSPKTFRNYWQSFKTFFDWCVSRGHSSSNPILKIQRPKLPEVLPRCISHQQAKKLLETSFEFSWNSRFQKARNTCIIATFLMTGIRLNELLHLTCADIDLPAENIGVRKGKGRRERVVPIYPLLTPILHQYVQERMRAKKNSEWFFTGLRSHKRLYPKNIYTICKKLSCASGVRFTPHMLRHTFARELIDNDFDIRKLMDLMGHKHVTTTQRYTALTQSRVRKSFLTTSIYT